MSMMVDFAVSVRTCQQKRMMQVLDREPVEKSIWKMLESSL